MSNSYKWKIEFDEQSLGGHIEHVNVGKLTLLLLFLDLLISKNLNVGILTSRSISSSKVVSFSTRGF